MVSKSLDEPGERPWATRWWRAPGEALWTSLINEVPVTFVFTWCHELEWGIGFSSGAQAKAGEVIYSLETDGFVNIANGPEEVLKALKAPLKARARAAIVGLAGDVLVSRIANGLRESEWISGRTLRKESKLPSEEFERRIKRLMPRFVRRRGLDDDEYSLTLPGLMQAGEVFGAPRLMDGVFRAIAASYDSDENATSIELSTLLKYGINENEISLAKVVANVSLLAGRACSPSETRLLVPRDAEMIADGVRKGLSFAQYLTHAATQAREQPRMYAVKRPWPTAPLWLEEDGSSIDYRPSGFDPLPLPPGGAWGSTSSRSELDQSPEPPEYEFMRAAIAEARKSKHEPDKTPLYVGAVVVKDGTIIARGHRGEHKLGEHAEYTTLQRNLRPEGAAANATLYCTLEPCTARNDPKRPCVDWVKANKITRVFIGVIDPNPVIRGGGVKLLRQAGIDVQLFPAVFANEIEALNHEFEREHEATAVAKAKDSVLRSEPDNAMRAKLERVMREAANSDVVLVGGVTAIAGNIRRPAALLGPIQIGQVGEYGFELRVPIGPGGIPTLTIPWGLLRDAWTDVGRRINVLLFSSVKWNGRELQFAAPFAR